MAKTPQDLVSELQSDAKVLSAIEALREDHELVATAAEIPSLMVAARLTEFTADYPSERAPVVPH